MIFSTNIKRGLVLTAIFIISVSEAFSSSAGTGIYNFLKINPSPKSAAVGASSNFISSQSMYVNPALIPWIGATELSFEQLSYLMESNYSLVNYTKPVDKVSAMGFSLGYLGIGGFTKTVIDSSPDGYSEQGGFQYYDVLLSAAYGKKISKVFSYGLSIRGVGESIDGRGSAGIMMSAGGFYKPVRIGPSWGFGIFDIGPRVKGHSLPSGVFLGFSSPVREYLNWSGEAKAYFDGIIDVYTGFEYNIKEVFFLRGGYSHPLEDNQLGSQSTVNFSGGCGFIVKGLEFDYAWVPYGDLGATHRISIAAKFDVNKYKKGIKK